MDEWTKARQEPMNIEVVAGGPAFNVTATHSHWLRFRGECRPMCGADAFWSTLTLAGSKPAQMKLLAFGGPCLEPYQAYQFTFSLYSWWYKMRGPSVSVGKGGFIADKDLVESKAWVETCEGKLGNDFKDFGPGDRRSPRSLQKEPSPDAGKRAIERTVLVHHGSGRIFKSDRYILNITYAVRCTPFETTIVS